MKEYNGAMMQFFHWYTPADGSLWKQLAEHAASLSEAGITSVWLPPAYKGAAGPEDTGYGVYDLFDLGEFVQKGTTRTKYGTRDEYLHVIRAAHAAGMQVYADVVFNHKLGGDNQEDFKATPYNPEIATKPSGNCSPSRLGLISHSQDGEPSIHPCSGTGGTSILWITMPWRAICGLSIFSRGRRFIMRSTRRRATSTT